MDYTHAEQLCAHVRYVNFISVCNELKSFVKARWLCCLNVTLPFNTWQKDEAVWHVWSEWRFFMLIFLCLGPLKSFTQLSFHGYTQAHTVYQESFWTFIDDFCNPLCTYQQHTSICAHVSDYRGHDLSFCGITSPLSTSHSLHDKCPKTEIYFWCLVHSYVHFDRAQHCS